VELSLFTVRRRTVRRMDAAECSAALPCGTRGFGTSGEAGAAKAAGRPASKRSLREGV